MDEVDSSTNWLSADEGQGRTIWPRSHTTSTLSASLSPSSSAPLLPASSISHTPFTMPARQLEHKFAPNSTVTLDSGFLKQLTYGSRIHTRSHIDTLSDSSKPCEPPSSCPDTGYSGLTDSLYPGFPHDHGPVSLPSPLLSLSSDSASLLDSLSSCSTSFSLASQDSGFDEVDARFPNPSGLTNSMDSEQSSAILGRTYTISGNSSWNLPVKVTDDQSANMRQTMDNYQSSKGGHSESIQSTKGSHSLESHYSTKGGYSVQNPGSYRERRSSGSSDWGGFDRKQKYNVIKPAELSFLLKNGLDKYLLIDCRSFLEHNTSHIQQSSNISCTKILKRRLQSNRISVRDLLVQTCHVEADDFSDVIVYDQCIENPARLTDDNFLSVLLDKLADSFDSAALLKGGFLAFQTMYPSLCENKTSSYRCAGLTSLSQPCLPVSNVGPTRILPFLYLGSQQDALSKDITQVNEITYVLNVSSNGLKPDHIPDGHFLRIPVNDNYSAKLNPHFEQAFQFLDKVREANGCCLVHCLAGISRSPTLAIAYIMKHLNMSSDDAYRYVKDKRPTISPNFNFLGQLYEFEKHLKRERELNNNGAGESPGDRASDPWVMPSPTFTPNPLNVTSKRGFSLSSDCLKTQGMSQSCIPDRKVVLERPSGFSMKKSSFHLSYKSSSENEKELISSSASQADRREVHNRPCVLNLGLDLPSRRVPLSLSKGREGTIAPSKSLSDIKEASETPSPIVNSKSQENVHTTSFKLYTESESSKELLSPFPCGETTIPTKSPLVTDADRVPYSGTKNKSTNLSEYSSVVKIEKSKHWTSKSATTSSLSSHLESKCSSDSQKVPKTTRPLSLQSPVRPGGKRPIRNSLTLPLSPVSTSDLSQGSETDSPESGSFGNFEPSACKIERKLCSVPSSRDLRHIGNIPCFVQSVASASTVTTTQTVKLKSFSLSASLPLSLMAQSPTTSLARLHFESAENSDNESDSNKMDIEQEDCTQSSEHGHKRMSRKSLNDSLERLSSFPSTSLDKLNFTPCLSSSNENLLSSSPSPRTSGVKRPLNMDIADIKDSEASCSSAGGSTASSPTSSSGLKTSVRKRDGRGKRPSVRPNSIAFSSYPTFDIGSEGQDSPHSSCSSASQDDTSDMYAQNGKKLKPSEYMTDVRFRLGRYSEREVYRQITAAMEAAMMKSQSFEATRKSRSLDDILSSEDDSSAPNCEWSHFDRVLRRCRDRFASPPHCFEKLACSGELQDLYNSNSSLSSAGSHSSLHSSIEFIQVS
ncbi:uncharacterized protein LOC128238388 [Mya arenaria]|uniref:uncharacterized protein LOC128238388 n=1 Tax=Mya arenaria TaxID=6604 RepID=UPI0022E95FA8|nr:uncharacterized protein LOC128238388 [Mya arenaria]XP_052810226.1 uncharacterized protein LOC128238388 [Mya arenaria]XP_052810227.1 uncharacterized protein LOC128238388 [Mya arenaria]XP_052810228.1 uncharacterized protein LOC128238388 [Mya arenaria]